MAIWGRCEEGEVEKLETCMMHSVVISLPEASRYSFYPCEINGNQQSRAERA